MIMDDEVDRAMKRFSARMRMQPPGWADRLRFWRCGVDPPRSEGFSKPVPGLKWARLVPVSIRAFHRRYAARHGLHWGPCVLCMRLYGGHQSAGGVPDPTQQPEDPERGPWFYVGICPVCTRRGKGQQR